LTKLRHVNKKANYYASTVTGWVHPRVGLDWGGLQMYKSVMGRVGLGSALRNDSNCSECIGRRRETSRFSRRFRSLNIVNSQSAAKQPLQSSCFRCETDAWINCFLTSCAFTSRRCWLDQM